MEGNNLLSLSRKNCRKGLDVKENKQETTKVSSLVQNGGKSTSALKFFQKFVSVIITFHG